MNSVELKFICFYFTHKILKCRIPVPTPILSKLNKSYRRYESIFTLKAQEAQVNNTRDEVHQKNQKIAIPLKTVNT